MHRVIATLAVAICVVGCGESPPPVEPFPLVTSWEPGSAQAGGCRPGWGAAGQLVFDPTYGTVLHVESGDRVKGSTIPLLWWPTFSGIRVGTEVSVLDPDGNLVVTTGRRYRIDGSFEPIGFIACGDEVFAEGTPCYVLLTGGSMVVDPPPCRQTDDWP